MNQHSGLFAFALFGLVASIFSASAFAEVDPIANEDVTPELFKDTIQLNAGEIKTQPKREFSRLGFSLGAGALATTGNRSMLYKSGSLIDLAVYHWIAPQLAIAIEGYSAENSYDTSVDNGGHVDVNHKHLGFAVRYYGDLHSVLPRVVPGFVSPFATVGVGAFSMSKRSLAQSTEEPADTQFGMTLGGGLRFEIAPQLLSLELMGRWNRVTFDDTYSQSFQSSNSIPDLTGEFISWNANVLVTF